VFNRFALRGRSAGLGFLVTGALLVGHHLAAAQPAAQAPAAPPAGASADSAEVKLSGAEMRARGTAAIRAIGASRAQIRGLLSAAREKRDVVKVLCLDDKSNQVDVALSTAKDRQSALTEALDSGTPDRAQHEFTLLTVLKERVDVLAGEAGQCVGEETGFTGDSELSVEVDPNLPDSETQNVPFVPAIAAQPTLSTAID
jgi:hypothetical protein